MRFRVEHLFEGVSLADYEKLFFDEAFNTALCASVKLGRKVIKMENAGGRLSRVLRITPDRDIPGPVAKVLGCSKIEYTEHLDYQWGSHKATWRTDSSVLPDKVDSHGTLGFEARGNKVVRWVEGEIKVKIFGIGGIVERFIVSDVEKSYENAAEFTRRWLTEHQGAA